MSQKGDLHIRLNLEEKAKMEENSKKFGFHTISEYVRFIGLNVKDIKIVVDKIRQ